MITRILLALAVLATPAAASEKLRVVASFSILADMARKVGAEHAEVTSLIGPGEDAHAFEPAPADGGKLANADVIIVNGLGFEGWMDRLIAASGASAKVVVASQSIAPRQAQEEEGHAHEHGAKDPHAWQDARNGAAYVRAIAEGFCAADAAHCADYRANAESHAGRILALDAEIRARFAAIPADARRAIISHDAFAYFGAAYDIEFIAARGVSAEAEPSAKAVARLITQVRREKVKALFLENVSDPRLLQQIGRETGIVPAGTLYSDALSDAAGPVPDYVSLLAVNAKTIADAMGAP